VTLLGLVVAMAAVVAGAVIQGTIGFGFAFVAVPTLTLLQPAALPAALLLLALPMTIAMAVREWSSIDLRGFAYATAGRIVGTAVVTHAPQPNAPHRAEIGKMLVHSSLRRRGLGARLLTAAEEHARQAGRTLLLLDTETGSAGEQLYRRCGWTPFGVVPNHSYRTDGRLAPTTFFYKEL